MGARPPPAPSIAACTGGYQFCLSVPALGWLHIKPFKLMWMDEMFSGQAVWPPKPLSLPALLPAYSAAHVQLGQLVSGGDDPVDRDEDERRLIRRGRLVGQAAVFKLFPLRCPADVLVVTREVQSC
jgi:hypothetical protein